MGNVIRDIHPISANKTKRRELVSHFIEFLRSLVYYQKSETGWHASFDIGYAFLAQSARHLSEKISCVMSNPHLLLARTVATPPIRRNHPTILSRFSPNAPIPV
jgi:hypothetical protein